MRNERFIWLTGATVGALDAALVIVLMLVVDALAGPALGPIPDLLGFATILGPTWLGPAVAAVSILAAGVVGASAAGRGEDRLSSGAAIGVLVLMAGYIAWTFVWTVWRTGASGLGLPVEAALLALAGLLLPAMLLFLPAAMLWAWIVGAVLKGWPEPHRGSGRSPN